MTKINKKFKTSLIPNSTILLDPQIPPPLNTPPWKIVIPLPRTNSKTLLLTYHPYQRSSTSLLASRILFTESSQKSNREGNDEAVPWKPSSSLSKIETLSSRHDRAKISLQITRILSGFPSSGSNQVEQQGWTEWKVRGDRGIRGKRTRKLAAYVFDHVSTHGRRKKEKQTMIVHAGLWRRRRTLSFRGYRVFPKSWYDRREGDTWVENESKIEYSIYMNLSWNNSVHVNKNSNFRSINRNLIKYFLQNVQYSNIINFANTTIVNIKILICMKDFFVAIVYLILVS